MSLLERIRHDLYSHARPEKAAFLPRFFKCGPGEYGEGDRFLGVVVPDQRTIARRYAAEVSEDVLATLLSSSWHEERLTALFMLILKYQKSRDNAEQERWVNFYLGHLEGVNNWDLVDSSAPHILGNWLINQDRTILQHLAGSGKLWHERIAILATFAFIKTGETAPTFALAKRFLTHPHDLIHKAVGWMLREAGKTEPQALRNFLKNHAASMPRTMLRYAIEKLSEAERRPYLEQRRRM